MTAGKLFQMAVAECLKARDDLLLIKRQGNLKVIGHKRGTLCLFVEGLEMRKRASGRRERGKAVGLRVLSSTDARTVESDLLR